MCSHSERCRLFNLIFQKLMLIKSLYVLHFLYHQFTAKRICNRQLCNYDTVFPTMVSTMLPPFSPASTLQSCSHPLILLPPFSPAPTLQSCSYPLVLLPPFSPAPTLQSWSHPLISLPPFSPATPPINFKIVVDQRSEALLYPGKTLYTFYNIMQSYVILHSNNIIKY